MARAGRRGSPGQHKKVVHIGVQLFPYVQYSFCFQQRYDLQKHVMGVQQHERPFKCEMKECKAAFNLCAKLRKHVTTVHLKH